MAELIDDVDDEVIEVPAAEVAVDSDLPEVELSNEVAPVKEKRRMAKNKMTEPVNDNLNENSAPKAE